MEKTAENKQVTLTLVVKFDATEVAGTMAEINALVQQANGWGEVVKATLSDVPVTIELETY